MNNPELHDMARRLHKELLAEMGKAQALPVSHASQMLIHIRNGESAAAEALREGAVDELAVKSTWLLVNAARARDILQQLERDCGPTYGASAGIARGLQELDAEARALAARAEALIAEINAAPANPQATVCE